MTPVEAKDEARSRFNTGWTAATVLTPMPVIRWEGKEQGDIPETYFVRFSMKQVKTPQVSFGEENNDGSSSKKFENNGLIMVQVFAPRTAEDSSHIGDLLAVEARDIFRGGETPGGMWFRNMRINELPHDGTYYRWNVIVEYVFTETSA